MLKMVKRLWVAVLVAAVMSLGAAGSAQAVDAPKWVAALYVEAQKTVGLRWLPVPGATGYKVLRSTTAGSGYAEVASPSTPQHFDAGGIEPGTTFYYVLQAVAGAEVSPNSEEKAIKIPGVTKKVVNPPNLKAVAVQETTEFGKTTFKVSIIWAAGGGGKSIAYNLYRSEAAGKDYTLLTSTADPRHVDVTAEEGKTYYYVASALDETFQETPYSNEKSAVIAKVKKAKKKKKKVKKELVIRPTEFIRYINPAPDAMPFNQPSDLDYSDGKIYVADTVNNKIRVFNESGQEILSFGTSGDGSVPGQLRGPNRVTVDEDEGLIYVTSPFNNQVTIFDENGVAQDTFFLRSREDKKKPYGAYGVTLRPGTEELWVGDLDHHLVEVRESGAPYDFVKELQTFMAEDMGKMKEIGLATPISSLFRSDGKFVLFDSLAGKILLFDPDTLELEAVGGGLGSVAGMFTRGGYIGIDDKDRIYAIDKVKGSIQVFGKDLEFLHILGNEEGGNLEVFASPISIDVDGDMLYVADRVKGVVVLEMMDESAIIEKELTH